MKVVVCSNVWYYGHYLRYHVLPRTNTNMHAHIYIVLPGHVIMHCCHRNKHDVARWCKVQLVLQFAVPCVDLVECDSGHSY